MTSLNGKFYKSSVSTFVLALTFLGSFYPQAAQSQTKPDTHIGTRISTQDATSAASAILGNINALISLQDDLSEGKLEASTATVAASTLVADTEAYLSVMSSFYAHQERVIQAGLKDLHLHLSAINSKIALADKIGDTGSLIKFQEEASSAISKIESSKFRLSSVRGEIAYTSKYLKIANAGGVGINLLDISQKGLDALKELQKSSRRMESLIAEANFVSAANAASMSAVVPKAAPYLALAQVGTDISVWYADILGDAVYTETNARTQAIYSEINQVGIRI